MTTSKAITGFLLPSDLIQVTSNLNRSALIEVAVRRMQIEGVVAVVGRCLQQRLTKAPEGEVSAKVTCSLQPATALYLREVSLKTGLSINQLVAFSLEATLLKES